MTNPIDEVVSLAQDLIRIDTTNHGRPGEDIETPAARYVVEKLREVGLEPQWFEAEPGRPSVIVRIPGADPDRPGLLVHGHLDVVPAIADDWTVDPFGGDIIDGYLYGRGAVDMKNMDAMILAIVRDMTSNNWRPPRDLVVAFLADEEAGGKKGAHWLVDNHPELFAGVSEAISELGGYSSNVSGQRVYLVQAAEKGLAWLKLIAEGVAGHGSMINRNNALVKLAGALAAISDEDWPLALSPTTATLFEGVAEILGMPFDPEDADSVRAVIAQAGDISGILEEAAQTTANLSQAHCGYAPNVIPQRAEATVDVRPIPGTEDAVLARIAELAHGVDIEAIHCDYGIEFEHDSPLFQSMRNAITEFDDEAKVLPYMISGGTDNKAFARLGIKGYGFTPLKLPKDFDFRAKFHGADECVPVDSLVFGVQALKHFIQNS